MSEFNNRVATQRLVLQLVNRRPWKEELFGLSSRAIERWRSANDVNAESQLAILLRIAASKLLCLATKSQEQVTEEYGRVSSELALIAAAIGREVDHFVSTA